MWTCLRTSPELFDICWYILIWHDIFDYIWARVATCCTVCKVLRVTKLHVLPRRVSQNVAESCHLKHLGTSFVVSCFYFRVIQVQKDAILVFFSCRQMLQMQPWWQPRLQMLLLSPQGTIQIYWDILRWCCFMLFDDVWCKRHHENIWKHREFCISHHITPLEHTRLCNVTCTTYIKILQENGHFMIFHGQFMQ